MWLDAVDGYRHLTPESLKAAMPRCPRPVAWARALDDAIEFWGVTDIAMLLAQVGHESADLTRLVESLHYSAERLMAVWPSRFETYARASQFAGYPEKLANEVYGGRLGNIEPGDGWRFRGRGPLQLTGRYNYTAFATAIDDDAPIKTPQLVAEPIYGALSACWYFVTRVTPRASIEVATREINGGLIGLADRRRRYEQASRALEA
ncbi:glycoside hydrolase family 19 protein [Halomonas sp.]|uniref:glycoside hydrolase family 19 protein n=1 Tax=Halomonas sp. TaxID=1486246 RepID=UPI003D1240FE